MAGITMVAATPALLAQDLELIPCKCSTVGYTYCYTDNAEDTWHWQSECGAPVSLEFSSGTIESGLFDQLVIFDGPDENWPIVYVNGSISGDVDLTGLSFIGSSGDLFMRLTSNATSCCATDGFRDMGWAWAWSVSTGSVGVNELQAGNFTMYPNPATSELHLRLESPTDGRTEMRVLDVTGREVYADSFVATGVAPNTFYLRDLQSGNYSVMLTTASGVNSRKLQVIR